MNEHYMDYHKKLIELQLSNSKEVEEETEKIINMVKSNIAKLFYALDITMNEFATLTDNSMSTIKRILTPYDTENGFNVNSIIKIVTYLNYPIECVFSHFIPEDIEHLKSYNSLTEMQKKEINEEIVRLLKKNKNIVKKEKTKTLSGQITIFDILKTEEKKEKNEQ